MSSSILLNRQFLLISGSNLAMFLMLSSWSFITLFVVELGGDKADAGLVMGSIGITSLGAIPFITPLMDRYGRKPFISVGLLLAGISHIGFLLFDGYSHLMVTVRLLQGLGLAACFNGCSTAVVDVLKPSERARGIGYFGVSASLAVAVGPYVSERVLLTFGFNTYFFLLTAFGAVGLVLSRLLIEPPRKQLEGERTGFFSTALHGGHLGRIITATVFGSGFAAMNYMFPLFAAGRGLSAGTYFMFYGITIVLVRLLIGGIADRLNRDRLILLCLLGYGTVLLIASRMGAWWHPPFIGALFGFVQGISYPSMMARMVDHSSSDNRAVVVGLFTGSFGAGINISVLAWGAVGEAYGLAMSYVLGGCLMCATALIVAVSGIFSRSPNS
jgi:predicted MFS family arabinose efflux permease